MNILYIYADNQTEWNCSEWRCAVPNRAINDLGGKHKSDMLFVRQFAMMDEEARTKTHDADLVIVQRLLIGEILPRIMELQANGKVVIGELDDGYHFMPKKVRAYKFWHEGKFTRVENNEEVESKMRHTPVEQLEWAMKIVHGMTTPSPQIAKDWKRFTDNTWVVPNYIDASHYLPYKKKRWEKTETFVIGWGGSHSHKVSWSDSNIIEALRRICEKYYNVRIYICGHNFEIVKMMEGFKKQVIDYKWVPHNEWPRLLSKFDMGLIPLVGRYDARRSWVKSLEYTLMGIPWVGTKSPPTAELQDYGYRVSNNVDSWEKSITNVIENYKDAKLRVDAGFDTASAADINLHTEELLDIYDEIYTHIKGQLPK